MHLTSLPGPHGCGDMGPAAHAFVDTLAEAGQRWWQMLPVAPPGYGSSPYSAQSSFAANPLLVALEPLVEEGLLARSDLDGAADLPRDRVDYPRAEAFRAARLRKAFAAFREGAQAAAHRAPFARFCEASRPWLDDFALYRALKRVNGEAAWTDWEPRYRDRDRDALAQAARDLEADVTFVRFEQYLFARQWEALRAHAASRGIGLIGDMPIFVAHDSADVWQRRDLFRVDATGAPTVVAGVPPDYFSRTGQRWGNPLYRWKRMQRDGYAWWIERLRTMLGRFDAIRIDHFIGFQRYWAIPGGEPTAVNGRWIKGPGAPFFEAVRHALGDLPLIAEDLGAVTPSVKRLRDAFELPGIKVLQFAFGSDPSAADFLPHNYPRRAVVYTGTHDNDTTCGWFARPGGDDPSRTEEDAEAERRRALAYAATDRRDEVHWAMIRLALASVARMAIVPMQDLLGLGTEARMNLPGRPSGNWTWRLPEGALTPQIIDRLRTLTATYGRLAGGRGAHEARGAHET